MISTMVVTGVLAGTSKLLFDSRSLVWLMALMLFIGLVFFFSCLNIFGTFFIIFYRQNFSTGLGLSFDLVRSRVWVIVETAVLLMVLYGLCFFGGTSIVFIFKFVSVKLFITLSSGGLISPLAAVRLVPALSALLLWIWLAVVNTFFNISLLLVFAQLVQPPLDPEFIPVPKKIPAISGIS